MAVKYTITGNRQLLARVDKLSPAIFERGTRTLMTVGERLASWARMHFPDNGLHVRSSDLRNSIAGMPVTRTKHGLQGGVMAGQGLPYAPLQEFGGTIVAKNAGALTIPIGEALTPSGVARFDAAGAEAAGYKTFIKGNIIFGMKDGVLYPLFVLVQSVVVPARPYLGPSLPANRAWIERALSDTVKDAVRNGA